MGWPPPMPALLTSTSSRGTAPRSRANASSTSRSSATSMTSASASAPRRRISAAVSSSCARVRAATTTKRPGAANASAIARPMPRPPPVTSTVNLFVFRPVAGVLVEKRQRLVRAHAIEEEDAVEVIRFVLNHPRRIVVRFDFDPFAGPIEGAHFDRAGARNAAANVRNAQAALPVLDRLSVHDGDLRIDQRKRFPLSAFIAVVERGDEDADALVHLRRRKTDAVVFDHRVDQVVDQLLHDRTCDFRAFDHA